VYNILIAESRNVIITFRAIVIISGACDTAYMTSSYWSVNSILCTVWSVSIYYHLLNSMCDSVLKVLQFRMTWSIDVCLPVLLDEMLLCPFRSEFLVKCATAEHAVGPTPE